MSPKPRKQIRRQPKTWRLNGVTQKLHNVGSSPSEVARRLGVSPSHVLKVCKGESQSAAVKELIVQILKKPWDEIRAV